MINKESLLIFKERSRIRLELYLMYIYYDFLAVHFYFKPRFRISRLMYIDDIFFYFLINKPN